MAGAGSAGPAGRGALGQPGGPAWCDPTSAGSAPPWRVLCKSRSQQPAPPCWDSSQDPGLAGSSQALFLEGRKFTEKEGGATEKVLVFAIEGSRNRDS